MNWNPMDTAPRDGTMMRLLVQYEHHPFNDDNTEPQETIGFNHLDQSGIDQWQFAGWDWSHDCFAQGVGEVLGWLPVSSEDIRYKAELYDEVWARARAMGFENVTMALECTPDRNQEPVGTVRISESPGGYAGASVYADMDQNANCNHGDKLYTHPATVLPESNRMATLTSALKGHRITDLEAFHAQCMKDNPNGIYMHHQRWAEGFNSALTLAMALVAAAQEAKS